MTSGRHSLSSILDWIKKSDGCLFRIFLSSGKLLAFDFSVISMTKNQIFIRMLLGNCLLNPFIYQRCSNKSHHQTVINSSEIINFVKNLWVARSLCCEWWMSMWMSLLSTSRDSFFPFWLSFSLLLTLGQILLGFFHYSTFCCDGLHFASLFSFSVVYHFLFFIEIVFLFLL